MLWCRVCVPPALICRLFVTNRFFFYIVYLLWTDEKSYTTLHRYPFQFTEFTISIHPSYKICQFSVRGRWQGNSPYNVLFGFNRNSERKFAYDNNTKSLEYYIGKNARDRNTSRTEEWDDGLILRAHRIDHIYINIHIQLVYIYTLVCIRIERSPTSRLVFAPDWRPPAVVVRFSNKIRISTSVRPVSGNNNNTTYGATCLIFILIK